MAFASLAGATRHMGAPAEAEKRVLAAFRPRRPQPLRVAWLGLAAAVLICVAIAGFRIRKAPGRTAAIPVSGPFYAISPGAAIESGEFAPVIRMRLPRRELQRIGLAAWGPADTGVASLEVDVLVGRDGVAKAVRLVRSEDNYITQ